MVGRKGGAGDAVVGRARPAACGVLDDCGVWNGDADWTYAEDPEHGSNMT